MPFPGLSILDDMTKKTIKYVTALPEETMTFNATVIAASISQQTLTV
jgi:hypothetical protein